MVELLEKFLSPWVLIYLVIVFLTPVFTPAFFGLFALISKQLRRQSKLEGEPIDTLNSSLNRHRTRSYGEVILFALVSIATPALLISLIHWMDREHPESIQAMSFTHFFGQATQLEQQPKTDSSNAQSPPPSPLPSTSPSKHLLSATAQREVKNISIVFAALLAWSFVVATPTAKQFIGGLVFRSLVSANRAIQVGDRVEIGAHKGIVKKIGLFTTRLETLTDQVITIPTSSLLSQPLKSINAGNRSSSTTISFYLQSHQLCAKKLKEAEDILWVAIQSSPYFDCTDPIYISLKQEPHWIKLSAITHVCITTSQYSYRTEVTKRVLKNFAEKGIPLATPEVHSSSPNQISTFHAKPRNTPS